MAQQNAATAANITALIESGFTAPTGLVAALEQHFRIQTMASTPIEEVRQRLLACRSADETHDTQSKSLKVLAEHVTPTQVWQVLEEMSRNDSFALETRLKVAMRDGLLPHDRRLLDLFGSRESNELHLNALSAAFYTDRFEMCSYLVAEHAKDALTAEDLAETGHAQCTPITRHDALDIVAPMSGRRAEAKLEWVLDRSTWNGRLPGPSGTLDDVLVRRMHDLLAADLSATPAFSTEWVKTVSFLTDLNKRHHGALSSEQADRLRTERPGLASDLLTVWLGASDEEQYSSIVREHALAFLRRPFCDDYKDWEAWLDELVESNHPVVAHLSDDDLHEHLIKAHKLTTVSADLRRSVLARRSRWMAEWLTDAQAPADPNEVRRMIDAGDISGSEAMHWYAQAPAPVAAELLNAKGLASKISKALGESLAPRPDRRKFAALLNGIMELLPENPSIRERLLTRILTADDDLNGPLDGPGAQLRHGIEVLVERWTAQLERVTNQG